MGDEVRPIDANALKKEARRLIDCNLEDGSEHYFRINAVEVAAINSAPTIDAVPVVRCKECQSATSEYPELTNFVLDCEVWKKCVLPDWYCCHGRRKEADHA